ncbi:MAG TPA: prepilin-type N-terminal cleavage/methylation domain-containing protein, partial [Tepidisphaeraceae bacterium]|nr:prepilin-type N-terminal cleavage/methylation domain-containing protein [Tepidisphaeraceae bacterium]
MASAGFFRRYHRRLYAAFSLIELLVVMAIIAILAGIAMVAYNGIVGGGKVNQTKATLSTLRGMLTEYENVTHFQNAPTAWEWEESDTGTIAAMTSANGDFWRTPYTNATGGTFPDPLMAPGSVAGGQNDRFGSIAVINTQIVMNLLVAMPVNRATLAKMSSSIIFPLPADPGWLSTPPAASTIMVPKGKTLANSTHPNALIPNMPNNASFDITLSATYSAAYEVLSGSTTSGKAVGSTSANVAYVPGVVVSEPIGGQQAYFRYIGTALSSAQLPTTATGSNASWTPVSTAAPLFLDAWGNPIIFVPGSGLLVWSKSQAVTTAGQVYVKPILIQSPDHKPFFASAGPDGDFSNGDDNVY